MCIYHFGIVMILYIRLYICRGEVIQIFPLAIIQNQNVAITCIYFALAFLAQVVIERVGLQILEI